MNTIPKKNSGRPRVWAVHLLAVGESIEVPRKKMSSATQAAYKFGSLTGRKFTRRDMGKAGVFIYREA
jgi:allophanate hydrolase subunit 2